MNLADIKRRVYSRLRDSQKHFIGDQDVEDWINDAYLDIAARMRLLRKETTGTTSATGTISLPSDFIELVSLTVEADSDTTNQELTTWTDDQTYNSYKLTASTPSSTLARTYGGTIETYPAAASDAYTLRYVYAPTALDTPEDTPSIPAELHIRLVYAALAEAYMQEGDLDQGAYYRQLADAGIPGPPTAGLRERPGRVDLTPAPSYWDNWDE